MNNWALLALATIAIAPTEIANPQQFAIGQAPQRWVNPPFASLKEWEATPAYFVDAPPASRPAMHDAVARLVKMTACPNWAHSDWMCKKQGWRYFQAVSGQGVSIKHGAACIAAEIPYQHFYAELMLRKSQCVMLIWHESGRAYSVWSIEDIPYIRWSDYPDALSFKAAATRPAPASLQTEIAPSLQTEIDTIVARGAMVLTNLRGEILRKLNDGTLIPVAEGESVLPGETLLVRRGASCRIGSDTIGAETHGDRWVKFE